MSRCLPLTSHADTLSCLCIRWLLEDQHVHGAEHACLSTCHQAACHVAQHVVHILQSLGGQPQGVQGAHNNMAHLHRQQQPTTWRVGQYSQVTAISVQVQVQALMCWSEPQSGPGSKTNTAICACHLGKCMQLCDW